MENIIVVEFGILKKVELLNGKIIKRVDMLNVGTVDEAKILFESELEKYPENRVAHKTKDCKKVAAWELVMKETVINYVSIV